ncbi:MAG: lamin tail domain-containing protein, partial [Sedimentisphaerales bacterium]|nr:lamin tail domain-containing protein [Sedimentisphaerales bacterium]
MIVRVSFLITVAALAWLIAAGSPPCAAAETSVVINELMASNSKTARDPQGQYDDWIELYNPGSQAVNMAGMYLTDDPDVPTKWRFPANDASMTTIPADGYLLIWADGDIGDTGLHASFRLNSGGDTLVLVAADGRTVVDSVRFDEQRSDISCGRNPDAGDEWQLLGLPTPGARNVAMYQGFVADTRFSHDRGFYDQPFSVTITTATEGAVVYYTIDGSSPFDTVRGQPTGRPYTGPVAITTTTCLRAIAYKIGWKPSNIDTQTYIFLSDVQHQATSSTTGAQAVPAGYPTSWGSVAGDYQVDPDVVGENGKDKFGGLYTKTFKDDLKAVPTISLVMETDAWFGSTGIYINQSQDGTERVCSMEWIDPNGKGGFQVNCAIAMQGGVSGGGTSLDRWKVFKLSMRPRFKGSTDDGRPTGGPSQLRYRFFPDSPIELYDTIVLDEVLSNAWNHSGQHMYGTYLQDQFVSDLHNVMGGQSPHGLYAHVYINGLYWGMYYIHERPDHAWAAQMFGGEKEEYDVLKHYTNMAVNDGVGGKATTNFSAMVNAASQVAADPGSLAKYEALCRMLDIDNFITDLLAHWFALNWDWPEKNWYATHRSPDGLWRFHTWDAEHSLEWFNNQNVLGLSVSGIHDKLKNNADYRMHFADIVHRNFFNGGPLTIPFVMDMYRARMAQIDRAIVGESARWGDTRQSTPHTRQDWVTNQNSLLTGFLQPRPAFVLNWLKGAGLYPNVDAPVFYLNGAYQHGGHVATNAALSMQAGATVWYTLDGSDPRVPGTTPQGGSGLALIPEDAAKRVLVPTAAISAAWRTSVDFDDSSWISGTGGVGYERSSGYESYFSIDLRTRMYGVNATCYIRVPFTISASNLASLTGLTMRVRYDDGFIAYLNGTEVQRDMFNGTPAWNSAAISNRSDSDAVNWASFDLTGQIDKLHAGTNVLAVQALNQSTTSSDFLFSIELVGEKATTGGNTTTVGVSPTAVKYVSPIPLTGSVHVKSRALSGSTWSALNEAVFAVGAVRQSLRISEVMFHPAD